jgi:TusA-related sulfurtransferase
MEGCDRVVNVVGKACPMPLIALAREVRTMQPEQTVRISGNDPIFEESIVQFCREGSHAILETVREGKVVTILIRIRPGSEPSGRERR